MLHTSHNGQLWGLLPEVGGLASLFCTLEISWLVGLLLRDYNTLY